MIKSCSKMALCLLAAASVSSANAGSYEDFFIFVKNDSVGQVTDLLERGFDPNSRDARGQTGLTVAMMEHSPKSAAALLARPEINVDELNQAGESPLMLAALKGDLPSVRLLLDRGARVNQPGWSALHYAASGPEPKILQLLIEKGADVDAPSPNGTTPLMMAAQYGSETSARLLVEKGADLNRRNQKDMRAVDFARLSGREPLVRKLDPR